MGFLHLQWKEESQTNELRCDYWDHMWRCLDLNLVHNPYILLHYGYLPTAYSQISIAPLSTSSRGAFVVRFSDLHMGCKLTICCAGIDRAFANATRLRYPPPLLSDRILVAKASELSLRTLLTQQKFEVIFRRESIAEWAATCVGLKYC